jgi:hypothetical protein
VLFFLLSYFYQFISLRAAQIRRASDHNVRTAIRLCNPHRTRETNHRLPGPKSGRQETKKPGNDLPVGTRSKIHSCFPYFLPSCFSSFEAGMRSLGVKGVSGMPHVSGFWFRPKDGLGLSCISWFPPFWLRPQAALGLSTLSWFPLCQNVEQVSKYGEIPGENERECHRAVSKFDCGLLLVRTPSAGYHQGLLMQNSRPGGER